MIVKDIDMVVNTYRKLKRNFKVRTSPNIKEIVFDSGKRWIENRNSKFSKGLFLFNMVLTDVKNYLEKHLPIEPMDELPSIYHNPDYKHKDNLIGIDLNHAYWRVAYLKEYISENTYKKGLEDDEYKPIRLSALSVLGKTRTYKVYVEGKYSHNEDVRDDIALRTLYEDIRFSTYAIMYECAEALGEDFESWKTDCIYFYDTETNRKKVGDILEGYDLLFKLQEV